MITYFVLCTETILFDLDKTAVATVSLAKSVIIKNKVKLVRLSIAIKLFPLSDLCKSYQSLSAKKLLEIASMFVVLIDPSLLCNTCNIIKCIHFVCVCSQYTSCVLCNVEFNKKGTYSFL